MFWLVICDEFFIFIENQISNAMRFYINYDVNIACRVILQEQLELLNIKYKLLPLGGFEISNTVSKENLKTLKRILAGMQLT